MDRLTEYHYGWNRYELICHKNNYCERFIPTCDDCDNIDAMVQRLGEYEDTGLEPEEIVKMQGEMVACYDESGNVHSVDADAGTAEGGVSMAEYIDKQALKKELTELADIFVDYLCPTELRLAMTEAFQISLQVIGSQPPADVAPSKPSEWIRWGDFYRECKICGYVEHEIRAREFNYCPKCGAKMRKERRKGSVH